MAEFNIRSDAVDVEQIMEQIRARVREKRGVDYTEEQIRELANVKLDRFLDPKHVRSDLLEHFRRQNQSSDAAASATQAALEAVDVPTFEPDEVYRSSRGGIGRILYAIRRVLRPILKLFINPGPMLESVRAVSRHINTTSRALALHEREKPPAGGARRADVRGHEQPRRRDDPTRDRHEEPQDARRIGGRASRLRRAPGAGARSRSFSSGRRTPAARARRRTKAPPPPGMATAAKTAARRKRAAGGGGRGRRPCERQRFGRRVAGGRRGPERAGGRRAIDRRRPAGGGKCRTERRRGGAEAADDTSEP